ncbi:MAG: S41 family peptidase [Clostridiales bacterium]|nr:S41 family peptidase [Clostridiales bacterium]
MTKISRKTLAIVAAICAVFAVASVSVSLTVALQNASAGVESPLHVITQEEYETAQRYARLEEVYQRLMGEYYKELDSDTLVQGAIDGMMESVGDPYTFYYTPEDLAKMYEDHNGLYCGVGMLVSSDKQGRLVVLRVFKNSPAQTAGLLPGDVILSADGEAVSAETTETMSMATARIKGEAGTYVRLSVLRKEQTLELDIERNNVSVNRVEYQILDGNVGYLVLYEFFGDAVSGVREALNAFEEAGVRGVIFDVRSNTGGQLDICLDICDMVLPEGLIVYTEDRNGRRENYYSNADRCEIPMVVLVNEMSASASEIFAASIQDYGVAKIVGTKTFGKGIVQTQYEFPSDGAGMQLTTSRYFTPKGRSIHGEGVTPDVVVEMNDSYDASIYAPDMNNDNQLKTAYDVLLKEIGA